MNDGLRGFFLPQRDKIPLADYFGVTIRTVERWFASDGQQYRRLLVLPPNRRSPYNKRIFKMFDVGDPEGFGDGNQNRGAGILQNMRLRCFLGACLGADGGLYRPLPLLTGDDKTQTERKNTLDQALHFVNSVYTGNAAYGQFISRAWNRITITPRYMGDEGQTGWIVTIYYRTIVPGDPYEEEVPADEGDPELDEVYDTTDDPETLHEGDNE